MPDAPDTDDALTAWLQALRAGDAAPIDAALRANPSAAHTPLPIDTSTGDEWWLPIHVAAAAGAKAVVACLLDHAGAPDARTRYRTPMHARATALHLSAAAGHATVMALLLDRDAEPDVLDAHRQTPLHAAASHGHEGCVAALLDASAAVDFADDLGRTALHHAVDAHDPAAALAIAAALLDAGADVNAPCPKQADRYTPLHRAVSHGDARRPLIELLLQRGADPSLADPRHGRTAIDLAHGPLPPFSNT